MTSPADKAAEHDDGHVSYQGSLLIAMPGLTGEPFEHSVIYLCQHDEDHAMGLVLNHPINGLNFARMLTELGISTENHSLDGQKIFRGGPVQSDRGFVLHSLDYKLDEATLPLGGPFITLADGKEQGVGLTASRDILVDLSSGSGPQHAVIALGYAGWGSGQLESELVQNAWLLAPASQDLLFGGDPEHMWTRALGAIGIDPAHLSGTAGNA